MLVDFFEPTGLTTSSGTVSSNTQKYSGGLAKFLMVKFNTSGTTFDFQLIDNKDREIIDLSGLESPYKEQLDIPLRGIYTARINNASNDESVEILLEIVESDR